MKTEPQGQIFLCPADVLGVRISENLSEFTLILVDLGYFL